MATNPTIGPLLQWGQRARALPGQILDTVTAPVDWANNEVHRFTGQYLPGLSPQAPPVDTSWHDSMVRRANQSFADADRQKRLYSRNSPVKGAASGRKTLFQARSQPGS